MNNERIYTHKIKRVLADGTIKEYDNRKKYTPKKPIIQPENFMLVERMHLEGRKISDIATASGLSAYKVKKILGI